MKTLGFIVVLLLFTSITGCVITGIQTLAPVKTEFETIVPYETNIIVKDANIYVKNQKLKNNSGYISDDITRKSVKAITNRIKSETKGTFEYKLCEQERLDICKDICDGIRNQIENNSSQIFRWNIINGKASVNLRPAVLIIHEKQSTINSGDVVFSICKNGTIGWQQNGYNQLNMKASMLLEIHYDILSDNKIYIKGKIKKIELSKATCIYECSFAEDAFYRLVSDFSPTNQNTLSNTYASLVQSMADNRISYLGKIALKQLDKKYTVEFNTAVSRIQRQNDNFKYNQKESSFVYSVNTEKAYLHKKYSKKYNFFVRLFPDDKSTVIIYNLTYYPVIDPLINNDVFGREEVETIMTELITKIESAVQG